MTRRRHSPRAKRNTRLGIELRMKTIETRIKELHEEMNLYRRYKRMGLNQKFLNQVMTAVSKKIVIRNGQLRRYKARYARLWREGKI